MRPLSILFRSFHRHRHRPRPCFYSTSTQPTHVQVPCKSSGHVSVSLYRLQDHASTTPVLLYLGDPLSDRFDSIANNTGETNANASNTNSHPILPSFLLRQPFPIAVIHYRWAAAPGLSCWPTPLHDVLFAYDWLREHLAPPLPSPVVSDEASSSSPSHQGRNLARHRPRRPRRDFLVYGARLGAGLATSLALTESRPHQRRVGIRTVAAFNGVYNWSAFVRPDATIVQPQELSAFCRDDDAADCLLPPLQKLFHAPSDLFDVFASPSLLFRTSGHLVAPLDWNAEASQALQAEREEAAEKAELELEMGMTGGRRGRRTTVVQPVDTVRSSLLRFPPRQSGIVLPQALFLYRPGQVASDDESSSDNSSNNSKRKIAEANATNNSYAVQAAELADLMRHSLRRSARSNLDPATLHEKNNHAMIDHVSALASAQVQTYSLSTKGEDDDATTDLDVHGQAVLLDWIEKQAKSLSKSNASAASAAAAAAANDVDVGFETVVDAEVH